MRAIFEFDEKHNNYNKRALNLIYVINMHNLLIVKLKISKIL